MNEEEVKKLLAAQHPEKEIVKNGLKLAEEAYCGLYLGIWRKSGYLPPHIREVNKKGRRQG